MTDKPVVLGVTEEDVEYFRRFKPLHYLCLQEMLKHHEAEIVPLVVK